ncbi:MAG: sigma-70 region 4 domain-containing protein [Chlorobium sp.]|jgi:hypothetical protein|nr:sigma-70 region 4 domain-containing protein [Chlorobium sp.]
MVKEIKTATDVLDDIFSLAYWMTGGERKAKELVCCTYMSAGIDSCLTELFKTFRACYFERYGNDSCGFFCGKRVNSRVNAADLLRQRFADMKLSVLLSEIAGLKHREISEITETSLETVGSWLSRGRKLFVNGTLFRVFPLRGISS